MIDSEQLFLYEYVEKGSRIVLYGLGFWGNSYLSQILLTNYCDVVAISDREKKEAIHGIPYVAPADIKTLSFDYIVVALYHEKQMLSVKEYLIEQGIDENVILCPQLRNKHRSCFQTELISESDYLNISLILEGGLGDYIVHEAFYEKLHSLVPSAKITICCNVSFGSIVFHNKPVKLIERKDAYSAPTDLIFHIRNAISIDYINENKVESLCPELYERIIHDELANGDYEMSSLGRGKDLVLLQRARYKEQNRYAFLGGDLFPLNENDVNIQLNPEFEKNYDKLGLNKYITFNCWSDTLGESKAQTKVWPPEYYVALIAQFKEKYPDIDFVQIGAKECVQVPGADYHFMGENLFLVEHIIKNAICHIDCEGGLVHLATALGTKCVVIFGPTPEFFYGYKNNINIIPSGCKECMGVIENWPFECTKGLSRPECVYSVLPATVMDKMEEIIVDSL